MDKFETQAGGHVKQGHEQGDISAKGIIWSGVFLAVSGVFAFVLMIGMIWGLEWWERSNEPKLTPMERQLQAERESPKEGLGKEIPQKPGEAKTVPDWYGRGKMEDHLNRTFPGPRLQYDDEHDMGLFASSEQQWLSSTGKLPNGSIHIPVDRAMEILAQRGLPQVSGPFQPANVGAPSAQYPNGAADSGQAARTASGGAKK